MFAGPCFENRYASFGRISDFAVVLKCQGLDDFDCRFQARDIGTRFSTIVVGFCQEEYRVKIRVVFQSPSASVSQSATAIVVGVCQAVDQVECAFGDSPLYGSHGCGMVVAARFEALADIMQQGGSEELFIVGVGLEDALEDLKAMKQGVAFGMGLRVLLDKFQGAKQREIEFKAIFNEWLSGKFCVGGQGRGGISATTGTGSKAGASGFIASFEKHSMTSSSGGNSPGFTASPRTATACIFAA